MRLRSNIIVSRATVLLGAVLSLMVVLTLASCANETADQTPPQGTNAPSDAPTMDDPADEPADDPTDEPADMNDEPSEEVALVRERCTPCHTLERVKAAIYNEAGWLSAISRMQSRGAQVNDAEAQRIAAFLAEGGGMDL